MVTAHVIPNVHNEKKKIICISDCFWETAFDYNSQITFSLWIHISLELLGFFKSMNKRDKIVWLHEHFMKSLAILRKYLNSYLRDGHPIWFTAVSGSKLISVHNYHSVSNRHWLVLSSPSLLSLIVDATLRLQGYVRAGDNTVWLQEYS